MADLTPTTKQLPDGAVKVCVGDRCGIVSSWHLVVPKINQLKATRSPSLERGCNGKANLGRSYQAQADRLAKRHGKRFGVYGCPHCNGYHMTTKLDNAYLYAPLLYVTGEHR